MATATARKPALKSVAKIAAAVTITLPKLAKGEIYAGILMKDGKPAHHVILLPGEKKLKWDNAMAWAKAEGGELPTRKEQSLIFANAPGEFKSEWYWSQEVRTGNAGYAWIQGFGGGRQCYGHKGNDDRARAVRRVAI